MNNKSKKSTAIDFRQVANLIYYKYHYDQSPVDDLSTALSYESLVSICTRHLGIDETELLSKKGTKYNYHRYIFIGVLFFYLNVGARTIGKKVGRHPNTVKNAAEILSYYFETFRKYDAAGLQCAVEKIITECEHESGGRFLKNVSPKIITIYPPYNDMSRIEIIGENRSPIFSIDEISDIPVKDLKWFEENKYSFQAFSVNEKYQATIYTRNYYNDRYLHLMQSFGYRFLTTLEYSAKCLESASKTNELVAERLRNMLSQNTEEEKNRRELEMYRQPAVPGKITVASSLLSRNMTRSQLN
jgi:hypothetical protein